MIKNKKTASFKPICEDIKRVADELKKVPEKHEYLSLGKFKEWQIRKTFGGWAAAVSASGALAYHDPQVKTLSDLRLKNTQLKEEIKNLNKHIKDVEEEALSSKTIKDLIFGIDAEPKGKKIDWLTPKKPSSKTQGIPVIFLSDLHLDEVVKPEQIQHLNEFNREIAIKRFHHSINVALSLLIDHIKNPNYDGIVLALGGDIFSGNIHEELAESNEDSINRSIVFWIDHFIGAIDKILTKFPKVFVPCVVGNHGRLHKKPRAKNRVYDNYEWVLYQFLKKHYDKDPRVTFMIPDGPDAQFQLYSKTILLTHGDQFRGGSGIAGVFSPLMLGMSRKQKRNAAAKKPFDLMMCGHFHQLIMTEALIINGSMKGYDEYAFQSNFSFERPKQALFVVSPSGEITYQMPIFCDGYLGFGESADKLKTIW